MKVKALKVFSDKKARCLYSVDQVINVTDERYDEMNSTSRGLLVEVVEGIESMTKKEIVEYAKEKGIDLDMKMTKDEMIKELG